MMVLQNSRDVMFSLSLKIGLVRFFSGIKRAKMQALSVGQGYPRLKFVAHSGDTEKTRRVVGPRSNPVLSVFLVGNNAQVGNSVVAADGVNVVHDTVRVFPVNAKPSKAVSDMGQAINANGIVAFLIYHPSAVPSLCFSPSVYKPSEDARFRVVMQKLFQSSLRQCKSGFSHVIAPSQRWIGQRIEGVTSTFFPRFNIEGVA